MGGTCAFGDGGVMGGERAGGTGKAGMDVSVMEFERGVVDCWSVWEEDTRRTADASAELERAKAENSPARVTRAMAMLQDVKIPLWQRISELINERAMRPMLRRERIRKLLKVTDRLLRAEMKTPVAGETDSPAQRASVEALKAERTVFWDPLPEVCFYLEIAPTKLAQYAKQLTGLGAKDLVDRIRVENLRAQIRERLWRVSEQVSKGNDMKRLSARDGAGVLLKALKSSEHFQNRQDLALSVGIASKQRLLRAVLACEGVTLEQLELQEAEKVFAAMRERAPVPEVEATVAREIVTETETVDAGGGGAAAS